MLSPQSTSEEATPISCCSLTGESVFPRENRATPSRTVSFSFHLYMAPEFSKVRFRGARPVTHMHEEEETQFSQSTFIFPGVRIQDGARMVTFEHPSLRSQGSGDGAICIYVLHTSCRCGQRLWVRLSLTSLAQTSANLCRKGRVELSEMQMCIWTEEGL